MFLHTARIVKICFPVYAGQAAARAGHDSLTEVAFSPGTSWDLFAALTLVTIGMQFIGMQFMFL